MVHRSQLGKGKYTAVIAFLFFFFFTSPALSPAIYGKTIYLYWIIPLFDPYFVSYLYKSVKERINRYTVSFFLLALIWSLIVGQCYTFVKAGSIIFCIYYLKYAKQNGLFGYLYSCMDINIFVAVIQFISHYVYPPVMMALSPTNAAHLIWGDLATETNFRYWLDWNDYIIRVCGWSREAGFFASLLLTCFICYLYDDSVKKERYQYGLFLCGYIVSFSKMSLMIIPVFIIILLRNFINRIPNYVIFYLYGLAATIAALVMYKLGIFVPIKESWVTRFAGYIMIWKLPLRQIIFGFGYVTEIAEENDFYGLLNIFVNKNYNFEGLSAIVQYVGIVGAVMYSAALKCLKVTSAGVAVLLLLTLNCDLFTATSFVVLAYWIALNCNDYDMRLIGNKLSLKKRKPESEMQNDCKRS